MDVFQLCRLQNPRYFNKVFYLFIYHYQLMFFYFFAGQLAHAQTFDRGDTFHCLAQFSQMLFLSLSLSFVENIIPL